MLYVIFKSQPVQTWLVKKATVFLSHELGTKVKIGSVDIDFFKTAVLENIYIGDQHSDTMFYFRKLKVDYHTYDKDKRLLILNYLGLEGGKILFGEHRGDTVGNYEFFIDFFKSGPRDPSKPKVTWTIYAKHAEIENVRFDYFNRNEPRPEGMDFNYNDMSFRNIHADIRNLYLIDDSLHFDTRHLETVERCGLVVSHIAADTKIHEGGLEFRNMTLQTPNSDISDMFIMETKDWKDYNDFNNKVKLRANLVNSRVSTKDLEFFSDYLKQYKTVVYASGSGEGYLVKLKGKNTSLRLYDNTLYKGDWSMTGLPDFENTVLDFDVKEFETDYKDLNALSLNNIPDNFRTLGTLKYQGKFSGFYNDFITFGKIRTRLGDFDADMNIKFKEGLDKAVYSGQLRTGNFKLNEFVSGARIQEVAFDLQIKGKGLSKTSYDLQMEGDIPQLKFMDYTYRNIEAKGRMKPGAFTGKAIVRDKNLNLDFDGEFLTAGKVPEARFKVDIMRANLATFGFDTTEQNLAGNFRLNFTGHNLDDANGSITGENIVLSRNGETVRIPSLLLKASDISKGRELKLESNILDANIRGHFSLGRIDVSIRHLMHQLIPAYFDQPSLALPNEDFDFDFDLKDPGAITALYMPNLSMLPSEGKGRYKSSSQALEFSYANDSIMYDGYVIRGLDLHAEKSKDSILKLKVEIRSFTDHELIKANDIKISTTAFENIIEYDIRGVDTGYDIEVGAEGRFVFGDDSIKLEFEHANLVVNDDNWKLDKNASALYTHGQYSLNQIMFRNKDQFISLNGQFGGKSSNEMNLLMENFNLQVINYFTKGSVPEINGISNGNLSYKITDKQAYYTSALTVTNFQVGKDTIGDLVVNTNNKSNLSQQHLKVSIENGLLDSLNIEGDINYKSKTNNLDLWAKIPPSDIRVFEPFLKGIMSRMKGTVRTRDSVHITGTFSDPVVKGELLVEDAEIVVDYLNATVRFSATIHTEKNKISILPFNFYDDKNNVGRAKGYVFHKGFKDYTLNLTLWELKNFHALNTNKMDNKLFYGQGYVTGNATFSGPFDDLDMRINVKTMPGTEIAIPISDGDASALPNYIHFKTAKKKQEKKEDDFPIRSLVLEIEATTDANIDIIFDEVMNERVSGSGYGKIRMEMNKSADFYMFGTYRVEYGKYLFTAFDLYNKPFDVKRGGTITWHGDPLDAKLNLVAFSEAKADPAPLLTAVSTASTNSQTNGPKQLITAISELYIKGNLFSPEISFGLSFPYIQSEYPNAGINLIPVIARVRADKDETSRQVFSLLLMKQFLPPTFSQVQSDYSNVGTSALSNAGTDLLSAQMSNWLNKIDPNWKVNIIYKNGTITLPVEYGVGLSTKFLNDRVVFDGSFSNYSNRPNVNLEYKVTKKGNVKIKAYTRSSFNQVNTTSLSTPITTNGLGIVYTTEFNRLFRKKKIKTVQQDTGKRVDTTKVRNTDSSGNTPLGKKKPKHNANDTEDLQGQVLMKNTYMRPEEE